MQKFLKSFFKNDLSAFVFVTLIALFAVVMISDSANAYERKVLFEDYTSTTCPPCAAAAPAIESGLEAAGDDIVSAVAMHVWWPGAGNDPWYLDNPEDNRTRTTNYYGVRGVPTYYIDGNVYGGARTANALEAALRNAARSEAPLEIQMQCSIEDNVLLVNASVTAEDDLDNIRFYISLNEDYYFYRGPAGQDDHYDAMVRMLPDANGTAFSIDDGETVEFEEELNLDGVGWHELEVENLIVVSWVQANDHQVHQSQNFFFAPGVMMDEWELVDDAMGDGDGRAEPGETVGIVVTLENDPTRMAVENLTLRVSCNDDQISFENDEIEIDVLESGEEFVNDDNPFNFTVDNEFVAHPVTFTLNLTSENGAIDMEREFETMIDWPAYLLMDAANNEDATAAMQEFFGTENMPYADHFSKADEGIIHPDAIGNYEIVIWHSYNQDDDVISDFEEDILTNYLDNGGKLVLSSPGYVRENANSSLMRSYFLAELDNPDTDENRFNGVDGDEFFDGGNYYAGGNRGTGAGYPLWMPSINALDGAEEVLEWRNSEICGVSNINDTYRTLLLTFPIESIEGFFGTDSREEFLLQLRDWSMGELGVPTDPNEGVPYKFSLNAAYPNPFNSSTMIPFTLDGTRDVSMGLFNISGRQIAELMNGSKEAGNHLISLDADALGLSSGVYYLKLSSGVNTAKQKILYIR